MSPQEHHAHPANGSTAVKDAIDAMRKGDWTEWTARHISGPWLDAWRLRGAAVPPEWAGIAELVDAARFTGSRSTLRGSLVELFLWNAEDPHELHWADDGKASARTISEAQRTARLIFSSSLSREDRLFIVKGLPENTEEELEKKSEAMEKAERIWSVRDLHAIHTERQVSEFTTIRGVPVKKRGDLEWNLSANENRAAGRVIVDFKLWTGWHDDAGAVDLRRFDRKIEKYGALVQAALYRMISEAIRPGVEHFSALLVVDPGGGGKLPREHWHEFDESQMQAAMDEVREALGQISAMTGQEAA